MELYKFKDGTEEFKYCSGRTDKSKAFDGVYDSYPISRDYLEREMMQSELRITVPINNPIAEKFKVFNPINFISVEIHSLESSTSSVNYGSEDELSSNMIFKGIIDEVKFDFERGIVVFYCKAFTSKFEAKLPSQYFTSGCSYALYGKECGLDKELFKYDLDISSNNFNEGRIKILNPDLVNLVEPDKYIRGVLKVTNTTGSEEFSFITNLDLVNNIVTLLYPILTEDIDIASITMYQGCDKTLSACKFKNNTLNFGGFPLIPRKNPVQGV